jgi:mannose-6-phosphate isomerase
MSFKAVLIAPSIQNYSWGRAGSSSLVASLIKNIDQRLHYAEAWYGAHPKSPSIILKAWGVNAHEGMSLKDFITSNAEKFFSQTLVSKYGLTLPFLFKVLSVGQCLSIQAHPDKMLAAELHKRDPHNYPDANHKPELAYAVSEVKLLIGFRPINEIYEMLKFLPALKSIIEPSLIIKLEAAIKNSSIDVQKTTVKELYAFVMKLTQETRAQCAIKIFTSLDGLALTSDRKKLLTELYWAYGAGDLGFIGSLFLNLVTLVPGEAMFIPSNTPHAHWQGDLLECMANSDNVVRGGATKKFTDVDTFLAMLDYCPGLPEKVKLIKNEEGFSQLSCSVDEFAICIQESAGAMEINTRQGLCLYFCLNGVFKVITEIGEIAVSQGSALLVGANVSGCSLVVGDSKIVRVSIDG